MDGEAYQDEQDRLLDEASVLFGMIDEVRALATLMLNNIREMKRSPEAIDADFFAKADFKIRGFHTSLRKYDNRLGEISQILKEHYGLDVV